VGGYAESRRSGIDAADARRPAAARSSKRSKSACAWLDRRGLWFFDWRRWLSGVDGGRACVAVVVLMWSSIDVYGRSTPFRGARALTGV